jgi:poly(A) polymerase
LLYRYAPSKDGRPIRKARIYTREEHAIRHGGLDEDALWIIRRLLEASYKAYIVGGAVRDLLLGKKPKDFDIATDARPNRIRKIFRNSRIIGRRFRLVHVFFGKQKFMEVSTFRSKTEQTGNDNIFGTLAEDAFRRDFTINALFYCPHTERIIDYVDGIGDINRRRIQSLIPAVQSFQEDPVRMIRAVKYASLLDFSLPLPMRKAIKNERAGLFECPPERLTEEFFKILASGSSEAILKSAHRMKLWEILLPAHYSMIVQSKNRISGAAVLRRLSELDAVVGTKPGISRSEMLSLLLVDWTFADPDWNAKTVASRCASLRDSLYPLVVSQQDLRSMQRHLGRLRRQAQRSVSIR